MPRRSIKIHIFILTIILCSCFGNAERDNPLDPKSERYENSGQVSGLVYSYYAPYSPLANAVITLIPGSHSTTSDQNGRFNLFEISPGNYQIVAELGGYSSDSVDIEIITGETKQVQFNLDGLPKLEQLKLNTGVINLWWPPEPSQLIECQAEVSDPDGYADIQSVLAEIPDISFSDSLQITTTVGIFQNKFYRHDLQVNSIHELIGYPIYMKIQDKVAPTQHVGPNFLVRVIDTEPTVVSPQGEILVGPQPTFNWNPINLPFPFSLTFEIFRIIDQGFDTKVLTIDNISSETTEYTVESTLTEGSYYWTITIFDEFGNWNRSRPATFDVGG